MIEVRLLGPIDVLVDGRSVRPSAAKVRAVLAMLALASPAPVRADALADRLWAGAPPPTAGSVLRTYVSRLRRLLPERVDRVGDGYAIRLDADELDARRFATLADAGTAPGLPAHDAAQLLREALRLWRGTPLVELADDPIAAAESAALEERRWLAIEALADAELDLGLHRTVIADLESAVSEAPLREQLVARLMLALYRAGRQADALAAHQRLRRALVEELGLEPSAELRRLEVAILEQDPTLEPPTRRPGNVPVPLSSLVGRDEELVAMAAALERSRLLTVTGAGGIGKTRFAIELAHREDRWPDGTWFVDLGARRDPADVATAVLDALGVAQRSDEPPIGTACVALRERRALLLLDNCEHVATAAADVAVAVLAAAPEVTVLATSRTTLDVPGEAVFALTPLAVPAPGSSAEQVAESAAGRLLGERIAAARAGRPPSEDEWNIIGRLSRTFDGLPLAIELVAARAMSLSVADLASRATRELADATAAQVTGGHHRSIAACVRWSLELLGDDRRRLLAHVCLLRGPFSAGAAGALAGLADEEQAMSGLADLARHSLLQPVPAPASMFRVLEPVRQVVRQTVDQRDAEQALDRLVAWAAAWTESIEPALRGPDAARLLDELEGQRGVLDAALDHGLATPDPTDAVRIAASISAMWAYRGHLAEGQRWLERAVAVSGGRTDLLRVRLLVSAGTHRSALGDLAGFRRQLDEGLELARAAGADAEAVRVLLWAGHAAALQDDHAAAGGLYEDALGLARGAGDRSSTASALAGLGDVAAARGDLDDAASLHLRSLAEFRAAGDTHGQGQALLNVAEIDRRGGRLGDAERVFRQAAAVFDTIDDRSCIAASREGLARTAVDDRRLHDADELYRAAIATRLELEQHLAAARSLVGLAGVLADAGRPEAAAAALGAAGDDGGALARRLRDTLGERAYLEAWADGSARRVTSLA